MSAIRPGVERVAVLRANGVGDLMFTLPALEALRRAYPGAAITLLGKEWHAAFLQARPGPVDEVFVLPAIPGITVSEEARSDPAAVEAAVEELRRRRFDLALQLFGGGRYSNPFIRSVRAGHAAGLRSEDAEPLDATVPYRYFQTEVFRLLEVVGLVGAEPVSLEPRLTCTRADREEAVAVWSSVRHASLPRPGRPEPPFVAIHAGAGDGRRRWPPSSFAAVARALVSRGAQVAVVGSRDDQELTRAVQERSGPGVLDLGGRLSLNGLAGLLREASLVIGNDSGPLHLARAVGTATVGIFWCGNLINAGPLYRSHDRPLVSWRLECPVCGINCITGHCDHHESFVADVPVEQVVEEAFDLLGKHESGGGRVLPWCPA